MMWQQWSSSLMRLIGTCCPSQLLCPQYYTANVCWLVSISLACPSWLCIFPRPEADGNINKSWVLLTTRLSWKSPHPPRTSLTLLTLQLDCVFWGPTSAARRRLVCSPQSNGVQRSAITMHGCVSLLPSVVDNKCCVQPKRPAFPVSCSEATWEAPMRSARMHGEPEYDVEKFGEAIEATDWGHRLATQAQREVSARRGTAKDMKK